jgi:hypothetical protein
MYLDISKGIAKAMHLEKPKCLIIWNGGSNSDQSKENTIAYHDASDQETRKADGSHIANLHQGMQNT